jgi:hypothetical protein
MYRSTRVDSDHMAVADGHDGPRAGRTVLRESAKAPRPLRPEERGLLTALLNHADFDGRDALLAQLEVARVVGYCGCGCASVDLAVDAPAGLDGVAHPIPNEARVLAADGEAVGGVLVFIQDGCLSMLEVYNYRGEPISPLPPTERLELFSVTR